MLSDRKAHLDMLETELRRQTAPADAVAIFRLESGVGKKKRKAIRDEIDRCYERAEKFVLFATAALIGEGYLDQGNCQLGKGRLTASHLDNVRPSGITFRMVTRTVKLPNELDSRLRQNAKGQKVTYSEAARRALADGLGDESSGINMLAALESFAGSIEGPRDLSTSEAHMDGFGARAKRS